MDMTVECIFAKLAYLLGKKYNNEKVILNMKTSIRGELTDSTKKQDAFSIKNSEIVMAVANYLKVKDFEDIREINYTISPVLVNSLVSLGDIEALEVLRQ
jgi:hypothetical protein